MSEVIPCPGHIKLSEPSHETMVCRVHHGDAGACARAMGEPGRAILYRVLWSRVKRKRTKLRGRMLKSAVTAALNGPLTDKEAKTAPEIKHLKKLLIGHQFWHDLRLICVFDEPAIRVLNTATMKRARVVVFP